MTPTSHACCDAANGSHDPAEIARFNAMAPRWWDPRSEFRPLHTLNPLRLDYLDKAAALAGKRILDVGCGGGLLSEAMARRGAQVTGIDLAARAIEVAELHAMQSAVVLQYRCESPQAHLASQPAPYDIVTCMEMLQHVPDPAGVLHALQALVRPGGHVFVATLNRSLKSYLQVILAAEYALNLFERGTHRHERFIKPSELAAWARGAGLYVQDITGISYDPLCDRARLVPNVAVSYLMHLRREQDMR